MTVLRPFFHVAFVVGNLETAMSRFGRALDVEWTDVIDFPLRLREGDEVKRGRSRAVYSTGPSPAIELFEAIPGTAMTAAPGGASFHHIGKWATDLVSDVRATTNQACPLISTVATRDGQDPANFALLDTGLGFYLELVDPASLQGVPALRALLPE